MIKKLFVKYKEIITYVFFGLLATLVSWGSYALFVDKLKMSVTVGNILSWICAVAFAFVTNKLWVFESKKWSPKLVIKEAASFVAARVGSGCIQWFGVPLLNYKTGFDELFMSIATHLGLTFEFLFVEGIYSKILTEIIVVILNYFFSKFFVFSKKTQENEEKDEQDTTVSE